MAPKEYPNIIFDLGGVILNIDYYKTVSAFVELGITNFESKYSKLQQVHLFDQYERGEITSADFRDQIKAVFEGELVDSQIDNAWNAMLLDLPTERLELLENLANTRRITLLSNTNEIHISAFNQILQREHNLIDLSEYFLALHYSFEIGMRKPEARVFEYVLKAHGFDPKETIFIDDSPQHVEGAKKVGINAYHLNIEEGESILDLF